MSVNKVILVGRVGKDPEIKYLDGGTAVANFPLATSESYKDKSGEKKEVTEWHNISIWRSLAEVVEKYVKKGSLLYLEGKIKTETYEKNGEKRYSTKIVCNQMQMLGGNQTKEQKPADSFDNEPTPPPDDINEFPF